MLLLLLLLVVLLLLLLPLLLLPLLLLLLLPLMGLPTRFFSSKVLEIRKAIELKLDRLGPEYTLHALLCPWLCLQYVWWANYLLSILRFGQ